MSRFTLVVIVLGLEWISNALEVRVIDRWLGLPLEGARVRVSHIRHGIRTGSGRECVSDSRGLCHFEEIRSDERYRIDVIRKGYTLSSRIGFGVRPLIELRPLPETRAPIEASGELRGFMPRLPPGGSEWVHVGIVTGPIELESGDFASVDGLISPWKDRMQFLGEREVPSNLVLPEQRVRMPLGSIQLKKERYRLPRAEGDSGALYALFGRIHRDALLNAATGGGVNFELLNALEITGLGASSPVLWDRAKRIDITQDRSVDERSTRRVPVAERSSTSQEVMAVALEVERGRDARPVARPLDLKRVEGSTVSLRFPRHSALSLGSHQVAILRVSADRSQAEGQIQDLTEARALPQALGSQSLASCDARILEVVAADDGWSTRFRWRGDQGASILWEVELDSAVRSEPVYFEVDLLSEVGSEARSLERVESIADDRELAFALRRVPCNLGL